MRQFKKFLIFISFTLLFFTHIKLNPLQFHISKCYALAWEKLETSHFDLFYQQNDRLLVDYIMEKAEEDYLRIVDDIGIDPSIKTKIYLAPDKDIYMKLHPKGQMTHEWSIGSFIPPKNLILLLSPKAQKIGHPDLREIMAHELTHFIMFTLCEQKGIDLPLWLHEGLAMYEARQWNWHYGRIMAQTSLSKSFFPLSSISKNFPIEKRLADRAYAQSISAIAYIINKHSLKSLHGIIYNLINGHSVEEAFLNSLEISLYAFEKQWHTYLRRRYTWIPLLTSSFTIWFFITILALGIYFYKKRLVKQKMILWELEDQINSSISSSISKYIH